MNIRTAAVVMLAALTTFSAAAEKPPAAARPPDAKEDLAKPAATKAPARACMQCGATCGLRPVCLCEPATNKQPKTEFDVTCEPFCIPACGFRPWPFGGQDVPASCTHRCDEPCECRSRVRYRKKLEKEIVTEEVPTVARRVGYVCDCCSGRCPRGCCSDAPQPRPSSWWLNLTWWWQRRPASGPSAPCRRPLPAPRQRGSPHRSGSGCPAAWPRRPRRRAWRPSHGSEPR